jgi:hypothetical protein
MDESKNSNFIKEIIQRFKEPWCNAFHGYFWGFVVGFGVLSVAIPHFFIARVDTTNHIASSLSTYFIALIASSAIEVILSFSTDNKASFAIYSVIVFIIGFILLFLSNSLPTNWGLLPAILGVILALFVWVIANADNPKLNDNKFREVLKEGINKHGSNWN